VAKYKYLDPAALARLGRINLVAKGVVEGFITGLHKSPYHGFSVEFAEHRQYAPGDELRHIDWKAWGRSDRLFVKLFEDETNVRCYILLDCSASMGFKSGEMTKLEYGCMTAGCLAYLMIRQQDSVGLAAFSDALERFVPPRGASAHLSVIMQTLEDIRAEKRTDMAKTFHDLASNMQRRSLVVIISDLLDDEREVLRALHHFRHKKHEVIIFHVLDHAERDFPFRQLTDFVDMETGQRMQVDPRFVREEYLRQMDEFASRYKRECSEGGMEYVPVDTSTPFDIMLSSYLARRGQMMSG